MGTPPVKSGIDPAQLAGILESAQKALGPEMNVGGLLSGLKELDQRTRLINIKLTILLERYEADHNWQVGCWKADKRIQALKAGKDG